MARNTRQLALESDADAQRQAAKRTLLEFSNTGDALATFKPEHGALHSRASALGWRRLSTGQTIVGGSVIVALAIALAAIPYLKNRVAATAPAIPMSLTGRAVVNSRPPGAGVLVDGIARGVTPLQLELPVGQHDVLLRSPAGERTIALTIENAARLVEDVDMPTTGPTAVLDVTSDPSASRVALDGRFVGETPVTVREIAAGRHEISIARGSTTVHHTVDVTAGATSSVFVSLAPARGAGATGTLAVDSPVELRLLEGGQLLGLSNAQPLRLNAGKHQLDLVNDTLELRLTRTVTIDADKMTRIGVPVPNGTFSVNASPWAEVFVDGKSIGTTPLGNVSVSAGTHELLFRHPQLGERSRSITIGARTPVRVAMDMRK